MEQTYVIENCKSFNVRDIFECGQCFRWNEQEDGSYTGIFGKNVLNVKQEPEGKIIITGICDGDIKEVCRKYFDLDRDYEAIKEKLASIDEYMQESIKYGEGIRILNQDLWEMIISFIVSANNNIPRIKGIIDRMSKKYGTCIVFRGQEYYTFPTPEALATASMEDLRALGLGFRDKYIFETTRKIVNGEVDLEKLKQEESTKNIRNELLTLSGVGPKVADCILLFSTLKRFDVFPIDVWVRRVMNDLYIHNPVEAKVNKKEIEQLIREVRNMLEEDADIKRLFAKNKNTGPQVEIAGVGKVSLEEAEKLIGKDVRWSRGGSGKCSKYLEQLDNMSKNKVNHIIEGSQKLGHDHKWDCLDEEKRWDKIKKIICNVMENGTEYSSGSASCKVLNIKGYDVEVRFKRLSDGTVKISDAFVR